VADPTFGGVGLKKLTKNALQNHCRRDCRKILNCWVEYGRRGEPHRTEVEAIEALSHENLVFNTCLNQSEIVPHRLVKVKLVRKTVDGHFHVEPLIVTHENYLHTTFPIHHFIQHLSKPRTREEIMTPAMNNAFSMMLRLHERAMFHKVHHWSRLQKSCLPATWFDRIKKKPVENTTGDGGCDICTWEFGKVPSELPTHEVKVKPTPDSKKRSWSSSSETGEQADDAKSLGQRAKRSAQNNGPRKGEAEVTAKSETKSTYVSTDIQPHTPVSRRKSPSTKKVKSEEMDSSAGEWQNLLEAGMSLGRETDSFINAANWSYNVSVQTFTSAAVDLTF